MKYLPLIGDKMSGSMGGVTASHNRGGTYFRQRSVPVNTNSAQQQAVRNGLAGLMSDWNNLLTSTQRAAWTTYAANVTVTDRLGEARFLTGPQWYVGCNNPRIQAGIAKVLAAPTNFSLALLTGPTIVSLTASTGILSLGFTNTDPWATAVGGALLVYMSRPQNASITFFKGPYRFAGKIPGAVSAPTSPQPITAPFAFGVGNKVFVQARAVNADGRISSPFRLSGLGV